jgi:hypothetical protein
MRHSTLSSLVNAAASSPVFGMDGLGLESMDATPRIDVLEAVHGLDGNPDDGVLIAKL